MNVLLLSSLRALAETFAPELESGALLREAADELENFASMKRVPVEVHADTLAELESARHQLEASQAALHEMITTPPRAFCPACEKAFDVAERALPGPGEPCPRCDRVTTAPPPTQPLEAACVDCWALEDATNPLEESGG